MSLNIKDQETHDLVKELAELKGTTLTKAIKVAVTGELERERATHGNSGMPKRKKRSEILQAFAREFVSRVKSPADLHSWDVDKFLYDENGLPK